MNNRNKASVRRPIQIQYEMEKHPETHDVTFWKKQRISAKQYFRAIDRQIEGIMHKFKMS